MIQKEDVRHMANLARLQLSEEEIDLDTEQLGRILGFFDQLQALDTSGVPLTSHPLPVSNAFREDEVEPPLSLDRVLANAPQSDGAYFRVPRIGTA